MIGKYRIIKNDVFDIARRIKEIDPDYFIAYNYRKIRFEVHNRAQANTFCLVLSHKTLDARTIEIVRITRRERSKELYLQIEKENQTLLKAEVSRAQKQAEFALEEACRSIK